MHTPLLAIENLTLGFDTKAAIHTAIHDLNLNLFAGKTTALIGESGCGKSLTALSIMQLLPEHAWVSQQSKIIYNDNDLLSLPIKQFRALRGRVFGMIFQEPMTAFNAVMTIGEQMLESIQRFQIIKGKKAQQQYCYDLLDKVGLQHVERIFKTYPHQLSGGMRQRAFIAMTLAPQPRLLIADEPTTALDPHLQLQIVDLLKALQTQQDMALLFITHNLKLAHTIADDICVMYAGKMVETGPVEDFCTSPLHPYTHALLAANPEKKPHNKPLPAIPGFVPTLGSPLPPCHFAPRCQYAWHTCFNTPPAWPLMQNKQSVRCHLYDPTQARPNEYEAVASDQTRFAEIQWPANRPQTKTTILNIENITVQFPLKRKHFWHRKKSFTALNNVSVSLTQGKTLAIVGESGSGKTTLAKTLVGLQAYTSGKIEYPEPRQGTNIQMVFQDPASALDPRMLIIESLAEARKYRLNQHSPLADFSLEKLMGIVGLDEAGLYRYPHEFSGGQRQRINIARALACAPDIIICDEPTSALDISIQAQILNLLKRLQREFNLSYIFISHDMAVVQYMADTIVTMKAGTLSPPNLIIHGFG